MNFQCDFPFKMASIFEAHFHKPLTLKSKFEMDTFAQNLQYKNQ